MICRAFCDLLPVLATVWDGKSFSGEIPLEQTCFHPWDQGRLERALARFQEGETPPPVTALRYRLPDGTTFYTVSDGNHRCAAAHQAGLKAVPAIVQETGLVTPEQFVVIAERLWRVSPHCPNEYRWVASLDARQLDALRTLGVPRIPPWTP